MIRDIYFEKPYVNLYLNPGDQLFDFEFKKNGSSFSNLTIQRPIEKVGTIDVRSHRVADAECAYGYGGYQSDSDDIGFLDEALAEYSRHCRDQNLVAEFIRFHPFNPFPQKHPHYFDFIFPDRHTVYVDLRLTNEERWKQYDSNTRNIIRKAQKTLTLEQTDDIRVFMEMYYETMKRNQAEDFYFFEEDYFRKLLTVGGTALYQVKLGSEVISSSFVLNGDTIAHYHLSANRSEFAKLNGNYFLLDSLFDISQKSGKSYFHLGGGRTNQENDSLLIFKKKFSKATLPFYIAGKVFCREEYDDLCKLWSSQTEKQQKFFLKYRLPL
jgi:hypothetical protein